MAGRSRDGCLGLDEPRKVGARVARPVDQGVPGLAVGGDRREPDGAIVVGLVVRFVEDRGALAAGMLDALVDVRDFQRQVHDPVAVAVVVVELLAVRSDPTTEDEPRRA